MRIESVQIKNFRTYADETIGLDDYTCLVGPNGSGKSTVLAALNIFFQERENVATSTSVLSAEDFHNGNVDNPIEIIVTFTDLSEAAKKELGHYVRQDKLVVMAQAVFDNSSASASVQQFGIRDVFKKFSPFFELLKDGGSAEDLKAMYLGYKSEISELTAWKSKPQATEALRRYEEAHPNLCEPSRSGDQFYGIAKARGKLESFVQWVYVPAVKETSEEAEEAGNTALGRLLQRTVRQKVSFEDELEALRSSTREQYDEILAKRQSALASLSASITQRLSLFSHPGAGVDLAWSQDANKSVSINDPRARVIASEGPFKGALARFGHGFQRSYLLAILQELALVKDTAGGETQPTLILSCEEPELYQHPPQARHLAEVLRELATRGSQVLITTHSPHFVSGQSFEEIRLFRKDTQNNRCNVRFSTFSAVATRIAAVTGERPVRPEGTKAKLHAALRPELNEMFFAPRLVLVEGQEDIAYITATLILDQRWDGFRRLNAQIIPVGGKSQLLQPLIVAQNLGIPTFLVFDADGNENDADKRARHSRDNTSLLTACDISPLNPFPATTLWGDGVVVWPENIAVTVKSEIGAAEWTRIGNMARSQFDPGESFEKNPLFISRRLDLAWSEERKPTSLLKLCDEFTKFLDSK